MTDKITARILVIALTFLAAIGLVGTLYLIAVNPDSNQVSTFVALAGVPIGAVAALATTRNNPAPTESPVVISGPPGPQGPKGDTVHVPAIDVIPTPWLPTDVWANASTSDSANDAPAPTSIVETQDSAIIPGSSL